MKSCHTVNEWLDAMVDDELGPEEAAHVEEHLRLCPACRVELDGLRAVKQAAASLPRELKPRRDLWEGIENRLQVQQKTRPRLNPAVIAVAATIVVAVALAFLLAPDRSSAPTIGGDTMNSAIAHASFESTSYENVRAEYEQARHDLLEVIEARRHHLAPETLVVIEHNMELIDQAIVDIEQALAESPQESRLDRQLQLAYQQQINLLRWAARLSA